MLESPSRLSATLVINGFLQIHYHWVYEAKPQEGLLLIGDDAKNGIVTASWVDSFHQSKRVMFCQGVPLANGVSVKGTYPAGEGPDWGWRIDLEHTAAGLSLTMYNISPDEQTYLAVRAEHVRA